MPEQQQKKSKTCRRCQTEKSAEEYYDIKRSYCAECERVDRREGMRRYGATLRGKSAGALQSTRKAIRKLEAEHNIEIKDTLTVDDVIAVLSQQECSYCGDKTELRDRTLDHISPMRYSQKNTPGNVTMACGRCNQSKNDMPLIMYAAQQDIDKTKIGDLIFEMAAKEKVYVEDVVQQLSESGTLYFDSRAIKAIEKIEETN
ncbi:HNH endonuclease [Oceanobacillus kimchii]|uniref:HNH endonuclease n=1 Tax=Oceanobacillus kimchii TaxID=746691 RepID=UPI003B0194D9